MERTCCLQSKCVNGPYLSPQNFDGKIKSPRMLLLATELRLAVLSELNLLDLISISHLDQDFRKLANDVLQRRIRKNLIGFLPLVTHDPFWALLNDTRSVVGGTSALQVCLGQSLDNNKLSLYVPRGALDVWISFWQREGFRTPKGKGTAAPLRLNHVLSQAMLVHVSREYKINGVSSKTKQFHAEVKKHARRNHRKSTRVLCPSSTFFRDNSTHELLHQNTGNLSLP